MQAESQPTALNRTLGLRIAIAVVVGNVIGSGIFLKPGNIAAESGNFGLIISVWTFGGILCLLGALCFAELATMFPEAGGVYVYLREAYGKPVGFLFGWSEFLLSRPASIGALAMAFIGSLTLVAKTSLAPATEVIFAVMLICGVVWVNVVGVIWGGRLQLLTTIIKAGFLVLVASAPFLFIPRIGWTLDVVNYASTIPPRQVSMGAQIGAVLLAVMWAYDGWYGVTPLAEEVKNPQRNIPLALFGGIGILIVLYLAANLAYHGVMTMQEISAAGDHAAERMLERLAGPLGLSAMSIVVMCSTFGAINSNLLLAPRVTFAMGRDGVFFQSLGRVHATYRTPVGAILFNACMAIALIVAVAVAKSFVQDFVVTEIDWQLPKLVVQSLQDDSIFDLLTNFAIFVLSIFYTLTVCALIVLRIKRPDLERPYRTWGYPVVPVIFLVVYVWFIAQIYLSKPLESHTGLALIALGIPVYLFMFRRGRQAA